VSYQNISEQDKAEGKSGVELLALYLANTSKPQMLGLGCSLGALAAERQLLQKSERIAAARGMGMTLDEGVAAPALELLCMAETTSPC
jgi:hypothetical protein